MQGQEQNENSITGTAEKVEPIAIYKNNIYALVDDVKQFEQFQGLSDEELKDNKSFFPVLVDYIYNNYIGELLGNKYGKQIVYKDIQQLDDIFNIYIDLVYRYKWNNKPFIVEFSTFTGINKNTFYNWLNGLNNNNISGAEGSILTPERSDVVQKWVDICERALLNGGSADQIRDIFVLKAKHGYKEAGANEININVSHKAVISADDLPALIGLNSNN